MKSILFVLGLLFFTSCGNEPKKPVISNEPPSKIDLFKKKEKNHPLKLVKIVGDSKTFRGVDLGDSYIQVINTETAEQNEIGNGYINYLIEDSLKDFTEIQYNFSDSSLTSIETVIYCTSSEQQSEYIEEISNYYLQKVGGYSSKNGTRTYNSKKLSIELKKIGNEKHTDIQLTFSKPE